MLTRQQAEQLLEEILNTRSETDDAECKSGTGEALQHALFAMSNRRDRNGGVVLIGVDENFQAVGVADIEAVQRIVTDWTKEGSSLFSSRITHLDNCHNRHIKASVTF